MGRKWTQKEDDLLEKYYPKKSNIWIANKLKRSIESIRRRAYTIGLGTKRDASDLVSLTVLFRALHNGVTPNNRAMCGFRKKGFPIHILNLGHSNIREMEMVDIAEFWKWWEKHQDQLSILKLEENLLGIEPAWAKAKRKQEWAELNAKRWAV